MTGAKHDGFSVSSVLANLMSHGLLSTFSPPQLLSLLDTDDAMPAIVDNIDRVVGGMVAYDEDTEAYRDYIAACHLITRELRVAPGEQALIVNGRVSVSLCDQFDDRYKIYYRLLALSQPATLLQMILNC